MKPSANGKTRPTMTPNNQQPTRGGRNKNVAMTFVDRFRLAISVLRHGESAISEHLAAQQPPEEPPPAWFGKQRVAALRYDRPRYERPPQLIEEIPYATWRHGQNWARWQESQQQS